MKLTPDDLCVNCAHCCLLRPVGPIDAPALCVRGWPFHAMFWNVISGCKSYRAALSKAAPKGEESNHG